MSGPVVKPVTVTMPMTGQVGSNFVLSQQIQNLLCFRALHVSAKVLEHRVVTQNENVLGVLCTLQFLAKPHDLFLVHRCDTRVQADEGATVFLDRII